MSPASSFGAREIRAVLQWVRPDDWKDGDAR